MKQFEKEVEEASGLFIAAALSPDLPSFPFTLSPPRSSTLSPQARRQAESVAAVVKNVRGQLDTANFKLNAAETKLKELQNKERELQEEHVKVRDGIELVG